jgi:hypothetical protein
MTICSTPDPSDPPFGSNKNLRHRPIGPRSWRYRSRHQVTDEGIFYCLCTMAPHQRSSRFQADFDQHGDIRTSRVPLDPPMIVWINGLPWFQVYKAFYVLRGSWNPVSYLVGRKYRSSVRGFYIGRRVSSTGRCPGQPGGFPDTTDPPSF